MSQSSTIEWTHATWNPVRGCTKISPGCAHCYAETFAERFRSVKGHPYEQGFDLRLVPERLSDPLRWVKPKLIFTSSMSDLFHADVPEDYLQRVFRVMEMARWHTFQVLTKRSERMRDLARGTLNWATKLPNVWWGVTAENRTHGLPRIDHLRQVPAAVRWLSVEPLLEDLGTVDLTGIAWVIVGGESGAGFRRMEVEWARSLQEQCRIANMPFFFKQHGGRSAGSAGRELDGKLHEEFPSRSAVTVPGAAERKRLIGRVELPVVLS